MKTRSRNMNLTEGTIWKQIVLFAFPLMCSNLFQQLYNTADTMVVGRFVGSTALAAVGSTGSPFGGFLYWYGYRFRRRDLAVLRCEGLRQSAQECAYGTGAGHRIWYCAGHFRRGAFPCFAAVDGDAR